MLSSVRQLVNSANDKTMGNHRVVHCGNIRHFVYHQTAVCSANDNNRTFTIDNGGWNTSSTNRTINDYRYHFSSNGYKEVPCVDFTKKIHEKAV